MKKILVIDDEILIRENIANILKISGYQVEKAADGREGITKALFYKPDLIICDINMPQYNGFEVLEKVRENTEIGNTPFVFLTAEDAISSSRKGMNLGADDYLTKPFDIAELQKAVKSRIERSEKKELELSNRINELTKQFHITSSHELNTPLNGIIGSASFILSYAENLSKERILKLVQLINQSGKRLKHTIDNIELYQTIVNLQSVSPTVSALNNSIVVISYDIVFSSISSLFEKYKRSNDLEISIETSRIQFPPQYLLQIIIELIDNALKFSSSGKQIRLTGKKSDTGYMLEVQDSGIGMEAGQINQIGPFVQFDKSRMAQQGSGLGLFIVKSLMEMNGGDFKISSEPLKGTLVQLRFRYE